MIAVTVVFCLGICGLIRGDMAVLLSYVIQPMTRQCHPAVQYECRHDWDLCSAWSWSRSVSPTYLPRVLSTGQISWKTKGKSEGSKSSGKDKDKGEPSVEAEAECLRRRRARTRNTRRGDVVHRFLAFGLALPQHPFSSSYCGFKSCGTSFIQTHIIVGNVYSR